MTVRLDAEQFPVDALWALAVGGAHGRPEGHGSGGLGIRLHAVTLVDPSQE